jgi:hypothetical protein
MDLWDLVQKHFSFKTVFYLLQVLFAFSIAGMVRRCLFFRCFTLDHLTFPRQNNLGGEGGFYDAALLVSQI